MAVVITKGTNGSTKVTDTNASKGNETKTYGNTASSSKSSGSMSSADQAALKAAGDAWTAANAAGDKAGMDKAHADAEAIRAQYGYSGGADGSQNISLSGSGNSSGTVNDGSHPSYAEDYKNYGAADKYGVDHQYAKDYPVSDSDLKALQQFGNDYNAAAAAKEQVAARTDLSEAEKNQLIAQYQSQMDNAHANAEAIREKYGYSGGVDGSEFLMNRKPVSGGGGGGGGYTIPTVPLLTNRAPDLTDLLDQWLDAAKKEQELKVDYAVNQGINELNRAKEDAEVKFQTQQNQVDENEAKALDNQALYAEARGDRGGIGQAQYAQIQATAMTNRRTINTARTKLATDTARQIADLRAQGEFQKADAVLELTQTYLSQLIDLEKWGAEFNLDVDKFNSQIRMWQAEFELAVAEIMGEYQGVPTLDREKFEASKDQWNKEFDFTTQSAQKENLASSGLAALSVGIRPSAAQQAAMGYTDAQIDAELAAYKLAQAAGSKGSYSGSGKGSSSGSGSNTKVELEEIKSPSLENTFDGSAVGEPMKNDWGGSYRLAYTLANALLTAGKSAEDIYKALDEFDDSQLTDAGLVQILTSLGLYE